MRCMCTELHWASYCDFRAMNLGKAWSFLTTNVWVIVQGSHCWGAVCCLNMRSMRLLTHGHYPWAKDSFDYGKVWRRSPTRHKWLATARRQWRRHIAQQILQNWIWDIKGSKAKYSHPILMQVGQVQRGCRPVAARKDTVKKRGKKSALHVSIDHTSIRRCMIYRNEYHVGFGFLSSSPARLLSLPVAWPTHIHGKLKWVIPSKFTQNATDWKVEISISLVVISWWQCQVSSAIMHCWVLPFRTIGESRTWFWHDFVMYATCQCLRTA